MRLFRYAKLDTREPINLVRRMVSGRGKTRLKRRACDHDVPRFQAKPPVHEIVGNDSQRRERWCVMMVVVVVGVVVVVLVLVPRGVT